MLASKQRLNRDEVKEVFEKGSRVTNQWGSAIFFKRNTCKVAVVVSKKISSSAVVRNRIRRKIYSSIENMYSSIYPSHIAILPSKALIGLQGESLASAIKTLLEKAHLLNS